MWVICYNRLIERNYKTDCPSRRMGQNAEKTIVKLKHLLGNTAVDIQHMGARQFLQSM